MSSDSASPPRRRAATNVALSLASLLFALAGVEVALRSFLPDRPPGPSLPGLLIPNPHGTGSYRIKPGLSLRTHIGNIDIRITTNSHGMHWREVPVEKPPRRTRIAVLGDSFTFGQWTESVQTSMVGVLESALADSTLEVLNFGVGGYGFPDMRLQLTEEVLPFRPDYVLLLSFSGNDFRDSYLGTNKFRLVDGRAEWDTAVLRAKVPPEFRLPPAAHADVHRILRWSQTFRWAETTIQNARSRFALPSVRFSVSRGFTSYTFWSQRHYPPVAEQAVQVSLKELDEIKGIVEASGGRLLLAAIPYREQVDAVEVEGDDFDIRLPQLHLERYALERQIPYLDLLAGLRAHAQATRRRLYWHNDPHLNAEGHRVAGLLLHGFFRMTVAPSRSRPDR